MWWKSVKKRRKSGVAGEFLSGIVDAALGRDAVLVAAVLFISVLAATKNYSHFSKFDYGAQPYHQVMERLAKAGWSGWSASDITPAVKASPEVAHAGLYYFTIGVAHSVTGIRLGLVYPLLAAFFFVAAGLALYGACRNGFGIDPVCSAFAAAWFLMLPAPNTVFVSRASPDVMMLFFAALGLWMWARGALVWCAVWSFLGALCSPLMLGPAIIFGAGLLPAGSGKKKAGVACRALLPPFAAFAGFLVPFAAGIPFEWLRGGALDSIAASFGANTGKGVDAFVGAFQVVWFPFLARALRRNGREWPLVLPALVVLLFGLVLSQDWAALVFACGFVSVLPAAAAYFEELSGKKSGFGYALASMVLMLFLLDTNMPTERWLEAGLWRYLVAISVLFYNEWRISRA